MAMIFIDGCDHYAATDTALKYNGTGSTAWASMQTGLLGVGQCGRLTNGGSGPKRTLATTYTTLVFGFRYRSSGVGAGITNLVLLTDASANTVAGLATTATGALAWYRGAPNSGGTQVATSAGGIIASNAVNYIEVKVTLATGATGTIQVKLNGADVIASTGSIQTANTTASMQSFQFRNDGQGNSNADFDDFYLFDTTGSQNNNFAGDSKIVTVLPNGNGRVNQWTRTGGSVSGNYTAVDETTPDGDTSYVSSSTVGNVDCYALSSAGSLSSVKCVQVNTDARKDDANLRTIATGVGNGTTESYDAGTNVGTSYGYIINPLDSNPLTAAAWATGDLTTLQSAIKVLA